MAGDNELHISYHDNVAASLLNPQNVLDYFCDRANPFYDRQCNNELIKMQRLGMDQLENLTGIEYILLHVQEPVLYVIRKQERKSPSHTVPLANYYIIAGVIYRAPDLNSVINSRITSAIFHIQSAFDEMNSYRSFHPSRGYSWNFPGSATKDSTGQGSQPAEQSTESEDSSKESNKDKDRDKDAEQACSVFQRKRVDALLVELSKKYPFKAPPVGAATGTALTNGSSSAGGTGESVTTQDIQSQSQQKTTNETGSGGGQIHMGSVQVKREAPSSGAEDGLFRKKRPS